MSAKGKHDFGPSPINDALPEVCPAIVGLDGLALINPQVLKNPPVPTGGRSSGMKRPEGLMDTRLPVQFQKLVQAACRGAFILAA